MFVDKTVLDSRQRTRDNSGTLFAVIYLRQPRERRHSQRHRWASLVDHRLQSNSSPVISYTSVVVEYNSVVATFGRSVGWSLGDVNRMTPTDFGRLGPLTAQAKPLTAIDAPDGTLRCRTATMTPTTDDRAGIVAGISI